MVYQLLGEDWTDRSSVRHVWNIMNLFNALFPAVIAIATLLWVLRWHEQGVIGHLAYVIHQVAMSMPQCAVSITFVFFGTTHALQHAIDNFCMWEVRGCWSTCVYALHSPQHAVSVATKPNRQHAKPNQQHANSLHACHLGVHTTHRARPSAKATLPSSTTCTSPSPKVRLPRTSARS